MKSHLRRWIGFHQEALDFSHLPRAPEDLQPLARATLEAAKSRSGSDDDPIPAPSSTKKWADDQDFAEFWMGSTRTWLRCARKPSV